MITTTSSGTITAPVAGLIDAFDVTGTLTTNVPCAYGDSAHVHAVSSCSPESYTYDPAGNLTERKIGTTTIQSYAWDVQNRLSSSAVNGTTTTFTYDAAGTRVKKLAGTIPTIYPEQHYECTTSAACSRYVFANNQRLALIDSSSAIYYYHSDHLGSSTVITHGAGVDVGQLAQALTYEPYGRTRSNQGPVTTPDVDVHHKFTGQELDDSTGLYDYGARYYDPILARFISADTVEPDYADPQSLNRYSYTRNNPLKYVDPSGNEYESFDSSFYYNYWWLPSTDYYQPDWNSAGSYAPLMPPLSFNTSLSVGSQVVDWLQTGLDVVGLFPVIGEPADALNAGIYTLRGDYLNAALSGAAMVPFAGVGATVGKWGAKATDVLDVANGGLHWGNPTTIERHFLEHGADFGAKNPEDYASKASEFLQNAQREGLPTKIGPDGTIRVYDPKTNTFGSYNADGTTKTFFKPTSPTYWDRQLGFPPWSP